MGFSGMSAMASQTPYLPRPNFSLSSSHCLSLLTATATAFSTSCISFYFSSWLFRCLSFCLFQFFIYLYPTFYFFSPFLFSTPLSFPIQTVPFPLFIFTLTCLFSPTSYVMLVLHLPLLLCRFPLPPAHNPRVPQPSLPPSTYLILLLPPPFPHSNNCMRRVSLREGQLAFMTKAELKLTISW